MPSFSKNEVILVRYPFSDLTAVKRGLYTVHSSLILKSIGQLSSRDSQQLERSLREWLELA